MQFPADSRAIELRTVDSLSSVLWIGCSVFCREVFADFCANGCIGLSLNLISLLVLAHACIPRARIHTTKFFHLSYFNEATGKYATGQDDLCLIAAFIVLFTGLRAGTMDYVLAPFAKLNGITNRKDMTRFSEQAWLLIYYMIFWPTGVVRDGGAALSREKARLPWDACH